MSTVLGMAMLPFAALLIPALSRVQPGLGLDQWMVFYVLPLVVIVGLAAAIRSSGGTRLGVALLLISLGVVTLLAEVVVGVALSGSEAASVPPGAERSVGVRSLALRDAASASALHLAAAKSHPAVVRALLAAGADRSLRDAQGSTAADLASDKATRAAFR